jgi:hypothetical protein
MLVSTGRLQFLLYVSPYLVAAVGGLLGGILLPLTCWLLLRRVPLVKTLSGTVVGTILGGLAGWGIMMLTRFDLSPLAGAVVGYFVAAFALRAAAARVSRGGGLAPATP